MAFVRIKRISGNEYGYLVANSWTGSGPRQKVSEYLGKVIRPEKAKSEGLGAFLGLTSEQELREWVGKSSFKGIAAALIKLELRNHAIDGNSNKGTAAQFREERNAQSGSPRFAPLSTLYGTFRINAETAEFTDDKGREIVFALNDGFLCSYTAKKLLEYDAAADYSGYNLADALTAAGIAVEKDVFISLFGKAQTATKKQRETTQENAFKDFYY